MKKNTAVLALTAAMALSMSSTVLAAGWQQDAVGWWWQEDDGSYPANTWKWIDGNGDGAAECYYFNELGYCLQDTITPDFNVVNADGAWTVNNIVQVQAIQTQLSPVQDTGTNQNFEGTYRGIVNGNTEYCVVEIIDGKYFIEVTWWGKDYIPYLGGGVFEDKDIRLVFNGNVVTISYGTESYQLTK